MDDSLAFLNPMLAQLKLRKLGEVPTAQPKVPAAQPEVQAAQPKVNWYDTMGPELIEKLEAFKTNAYRDSKGIPTYGHGFIVNLKTGNPVRMGDTITREESLAALKKNMAVFDEGFKKDYPNYRYLSDREKSGLFSLLHNQTNKYGRIDKYPNLTEIMTRPINDDIDLTHMYDDFRRELLHWGDKKNPELKPRRRAEHWFMKTGELYDQAWFKESEKATPPKRR